MVKVETRTVGLPSIAIIAISDFLSLWVASVSCPMRLSELYRQASQDIASSQAYIQTLLLVFLEFLILLTAA